MLTKKHKDIQKGTTGMDFDAYTRRILLLQDHKTINKKIPEKKSHKRLQVKNGKMNMV